MSVSGPGPTGLHILTRLLASGASRSEALVAQTVGILAFLSASIESISMLGNLFNHAFSNQRSIYCINAITL